MTPRPALAALASAAPAALVLGTGLAWLDRLPHTLPVHWSGLGSPDGFAGATATWTEVLVLATASALAGMAAAAGYPRRATGSRWLLTAAGAAGGTAAGSWLAIAGSTLAAPSAAEAHLGWRLLLTLAGLAWGAVVWAAAGPVPVRAQAAGAAADPLVLAPGERAAWMVTLHPRVILVTGALGIAASAAAAIAAVPGYLLAVAVFAAILLAFGEVRVSVDRRGLRLVAGLVRVPIKRIPLEHIASAAAENIHAMQWGGWGYRIMPGRSALVLRSGPALVVTLRDGHRFAVTVPDPHTPAALLEGLRTPA
ncbi:MAG: hypothetical protein QOJ50_4002 [Cryptosporangiaceae bacterium]|nr:hypothetical protein [Cryptosporangiaceae bacterium]